MKYRYKYPPFLGITMLVVVIGEIFLANISYTTNSEPFIKIFYTILLFSGLFVVLPLGLISILKWFAVSRNEIYIEFIDNYLKVPSIHIELLCFDTAKNIKFKFSKLKIDSFEETGHFKKIKLVRLTDNNGKQFNIMTINFNNLNEYENFCQRLQDSIY